MDSTHPLIVILYLLTYTLAAAGLFLPLVAHRASKDPVILSTGRFLRFLALAAIIPSLQVILDAIGFTGELPGSWPTVVRLAMNGLTMAGLGLASITWAAMNRSFSPSRYFTDRLGSVPAVIILIVMGANVTVQIIAELTGSEPATLAAGWGILAYFTVLAVIIILSSVRLFRPGAISSARGGTVALKALNLVPSVFILLSLIPGSWPVVLSPLALIALFTLGLVVFFRQSAGTDDADRSRQALFDESGLTPREREIALKLAEGLSYKEISDTLFVSLSTIQTHVTRIYGKMGVNSKTELSRKIGGM